MSVAGPLCAFGLALLFAGVYLALTGPRRVDSWGLVSLGAAAIGAGYELLSKGM